MAAYFARVGEDQLREDTEKKMAKPKRDKAWRDFVSRAMGDMAPMWDALSPAERERTLALHSEDADLNAIGCGTHKECGSERLRLARTAGIFVACHSSGLVTRPSRS